METETVLRYLRSLLTEISVELLYVCVDTESPRTKVPNLFDLNEEFHLGLALAFVEKNVFPFARSYFDNFQLVFSYIWSMGRKFGK